MSTSTFLKIFLCIGLNFICMLNVSFAADSTMLNPAVTGYTFQSQIQVNNVNQASLSASQIQTIIENLNMSWNTTSAYMPGGAYDCQSFQQTSLCHANASQNNTSLCPTFCIAYRVPQSPMYVTLPGSQPTTQSANNAIGSGFRNYPPVLMSSAQTGCATPPCQPQCPINYQTYPITTLLAPGHDFQYNAQPFGSFQTGPIRANNTQGSTVANHQQYYISGWGFDQSVGGYEVGTIGYYAMLGYTCNTSNNLASFGPFPTHAGGFVTMNYPGGAVTSATGYSNSLPSAAPDSGYWSAGYVRDDIPGSAPYLAYIASNATSVSGGYSWTSYYLTCDVPAGWYYAPPIVSTAEICVPIQSGWEHS